MQNGIPKICLNKFPDNWENSLAWWYSVSRLIYTAGRIFVIVAKFFEVIEKYATCRTDAQAKTAIDKATSVEDYQAKEPTKN